MTRIDRNQTLAFQSTTLFCSDGCCPQLEWLTISLIEVDAEQENGGGEEIVNLLKHVRPGNGFEFKGDMFDKVDLIRQFCFLPFCIFLVLKLMFAEPNTFFFFVEIIFVWTGGGEWRE